MEEKKQFDFEAFKRDAIEKLTQGNKINGSEGVFQPLLKHFLESALDAEIDAHLDKEERQSGNRKNGKSVKLVKSSSGEFELQTPRDRQGTFDPQIVSKRQVIITDELETKVLRLYSKGMSYDQIIDDIEELYGFSLSPGTLTTITDKIIPELNAWRNRELQSTYAFVWFDAMFYKVRQEGRVINKAMYNIVGYDVNGIKDLLGVYIAETEGAHFWAQVIDDLQRRGVKDILIASIDNLKGFKEVIEKLMPDTVVQSCIVHQIRNTMNFIPFKHRREMIADLKTVYGAKDKIEAESNLEIVENKWKGKYHQAIDSWKRNWDNLSNFYDYPEPIRKLMYTTNPIEGFHRQIRKLTKTKSAFTNDMAFLKLIYLGCKNIAEKWQNQRQNWPSILTHLQIIFGDRVKTDYVSSY